MGNNQLHEQSGLQVNGQFLSAFGYSNDNYYIGLTIVADEMYSNWQNNKDIIYTFSKTKLIYAKRIHTRPVKADKPVDIWE